MVLQVVMFPLREFHNLAPYMEMSIDLALVRKRVMQNESSTIYIHMWVYTVFANYLDIHYEKP